MNGVHKANFVTMRMLLFSMLLMLGFSSVFGQQENVLRIGLYGGRSLTKAVAQANEGNYQINVDGERITTVHRAEAITFSVAGNLVAVYSAQKLLGKYPRVVLKSLHTTSSFRLKMSNAGGTVKNSVYPDNLIVRVKGGSLLLVNETAIDRYVGGVTEAESGKGNDLEFYKVQATIARTYALSNIRRHAVNGFNLCDEVHCQAYHGKSRFEPLIDEAVSATEDQVLVDSDIRLITAAFHSNCGGHTLNSEHVWSKPLPYLVGRPDSFCLVMPHSHWERSIDKQSWVAYLNDFSAYRPDTIPGDSSMHLAYYPTSRQRFFADNLKQLKMTRIRKDFGLRSAFFVIEENGDSVNFTGRGFGHGVGLCQEGAMRMAQLGHDCRDIVHFYYKDVHIINRRNIYFFED